MFGVRGDGFQLRGRAMRLNSRARVGAVGALIATFIAVAAWSATLAWDVEYHSSDWSIRLSYGCIAYSTYLGATSDIRALRYRDAPLNGWKVTRSSWNNLNSFDDWRWRFGLFLPRINRFSYANPAYSQLLKPVRAIVIATPIWVFVVVALGVAVILIAQTRKRNRAGCCQRCGYDLTANASGACPECGTPTSAHVNRS